MDKTETPKKSIATIKERKKAQPNAVLFLSPEEKQVIKETVGKNLSDPQYKIFVYTCQALGLNPLLNEIAAIVYTDHKSGEKTMSIQVMRDGFLTIAHRSGKFAGLESGIKQDEGKPLIGWAKVYHKDFKVPVYQEAEFSEYTSARNPLWNSKPHTMIKKVAESMALRKAFNVSGVYAPEEMEKEIQVVAEPKVLEVENASEPATEAQLAILQSFLEPQHFMKIKKNMTKGEAVKLIQEQTK